MRLSNIVSIFMWHDLDNYKYFFIFINYIVIFWLTLVCILKHIDSISHRTLAPLDPLA